MDFDLFGDDDDDDILSAVLIEPSQLEADTEHLLSNDALPEFQCAGEDSQSAPFSSEGFIKNGFISNKQLHSNLVLKEITLSAYEFNAAHMHSQLNLEFLFGNACMHVQYLYTCVRCGGGAGSGGPSTGYANSSCADEYSNYQRRRQVTLFLHILLNTTQQESWLTLRNRLGSFRTLLNRISEADTWKSVHFANSSKGNECNVPAYHLLHGLLEWKFLDLCILHKYELPYAAANSNRGNNDDQEVKRAICVLKQQLERVVEDLVVCSIYLYAKKRSTDLLSSSPFSCTCFKEFWLLLQLVLTKWNITNERETFSFWGLFNGTLEKLRSKIESFALTPLAYCEFSNWLLHSLCRLYGYRSNGQFEGSPYTRVSIDAMENYEFCESCTQQLLQCQPGEEQLRIYLCLLAPMLLQWWRPNVTLPTLLWEFFHKRLNSSFYIAGAAPSNLAVVCNNGRMYVERYRALLQQSKPDPNLSSYTLFVLLLGRSVERLLQAQGSHQALKLLGRIYTKFSLQKFLALNETGLHHLIELFLVLLMCGDFHELAPKLRDKLLSISFNKITNSRQIAVARGHMAILLLYAEQRFNMSDYISKLLQQLLDIRNDLAVSKIVADGLLDIFTHADDFARGEHLLIDAWLANFLNNCTPTEQERTLEALHMIFAKVQRHELFVEADGGLIKALNTHVLPYIKQQYVVSYSSWMPQLAADFCVHSSALADTQGFQRLFQYFSETQTANKQCLPQFLLKVLESERSTQVEPAIIMHVWLKSLVPLGATNEEVIKLSCHVVQLPVFKFMTALQADEVLRAKEPLCVFIAAVGKQYDACTNYEHRCQIVDNFNAYIRNFDRWLPPVTNAPKISIMNDNKLEKNDITFRFYSFLAIVIYNCPQIVYVKSKITCFFHVAITRFVLPTNVQMGKQPETKLTQIIHKIWPVVVQGIGRLNFKSDPYIGKTLNDLIQKWTPHFKISPSARIVARPYILCVQGDNQELSLTMFERLTSMFLATQRRQADPNACLVITIFQEVIEAIAADANNPNGNSSESRLETFMKGTCLMMLEHIMMVDDVVPSRALLLELFKRLTTNVVYMNSEHLPELLAEHLRIITKKHLAYYTFFCFDLLTKIAQISPTLVERMMEFLLAEVRVVENKRGAGEDNRIRSCLQKLLNCVANSSSKK